MIVACGGPKAAISRQYAASHIQAGNSRAVPGRSSSHKTGWPPRTVRFTTRSVFPYSGCHGYSTRADSKLYAE